MKVKLGKHWNSGRGIYQAGETIEVNQSQAESIVRIGKGEIVEDKPKRKRKSTSEKEEKGGKSTKEEKTEITTKDE